MTENKVKEVIVLGCGPTFAECRYHCETWGVNGTYTFAQGKGKRLDKLFMSDIESEVKTCWYDLPRMLKSNTTLVLPIPYERLAKIGLPIEIYPMDKVRVKFPTTFFSNTICYMIAYALVHTKITHGLDGARPEVVEGYNKIWLYGIDMMTNSTYAYEKGGVEYWMGVALGMGVDVINTKGSATGKTYNGRMYGYWGQAPEERAKEKLYAPWEMVRVSTAQNPEDEWVKTAKGDWVKIPAGQVRDASGIPNAPL